MNQDSELVSALASRVARLESVTRILVVLIVLLLFGAGLVFLRDHRRSDRSDTIEASRILIRGAHGDTAAFFGLDSLPGEGGNEIGSILRVDHAEIGNDWGKSRVIVGTGSEGGTYIRILGYDGMVRAELTLSDDDSEAYFQVYDSSGRTTFSTPLRSDSLRNQSSGPTKD
jgi:hypothetical protein